MEKKVCKYITLHYILNARVKELTLHINITLECIRKRGDFTCKYPVVSYFL